MNLGQSLMALLALVLFTTITMSINRLRINATMQTIEHQVESEAINYGQSLMEIVTNTASNDAGFESLYSIFNNWTGQQTFTAGSGRTLYAHISVNTSPSLVRHTVPYRLVTISIYSTPDMLPNQLKSRYSASYSIWWE